MNRNDFKNPLIQSGALLLLVFLLIALVVNSPAEGFFGGIFAIIVGIVKTVLFLFGLALALICSIAILVAIFLLATSIYSADKARHLTSQLKLELQRLYSRVRGDIPERPEPVAPAETEPQPEPTATPSAAPPPTEWQQQLARLNAQAEAMEVSLAENSELTASLRQELKQLKLSDRSETADTAAEGLAERLDSQAAALEQLVQRIDRLETRFSQELAALAQEFSALQEQTAAPQMVSGILAYLDTAEDREALTEAAEEAVSRGMTYSQADDLFKKKLSRPVYQVLTEHPRLTKDYIRSIKKKFA